MQFLYQGPRLDTSTHPAPCLNAVSFFPSSCLDAVSLHWALSRRLLPCCGLCSVAVAPAPDSVWTPFPFTSLVGSRFSFPGLLSDGNSPVLGPVRTPLSLPRASFFSMPPSKCPVPFPVKGPCTLGRAFLTAASGLPLSLPAQSIRTVNVASWTCLLDWQRPLPEIATPSLRKHERSQPGGR